jgi:hypothetical protein
MVTELCLLRRNCSSGARSSQSPPFWTGVAESEDGVGTVLQDNGGAAIGVSKIVQDDV